MLFQLTLTVVYTLMSMQVLHDDEDYRGINA
jgi:hypothetical protein